MDWMAGHSKWKNIKIRKGKQDAIRGKLFTKLAREIIVAAKLGGGDLATNARLRVAVEKAKENSLPRENIERAIAKGSGDSDSENYEEIVYEGKGPGGIAVIVEVYSENRNRTVGDLRHAFSKNGGALGENGSVAWQFRHCGSISVSKHDIDEETLTLAALDAGADDVLDDDDSYQVVTPVEALHACNDALTRDGIKTTDVELTWLPTQNATPSEDDMRRFIKLFNALEDLDDVKETFSNVEIPDSLFEED